jgi:ubiquinone/menaquinone biosynthesis C-methylase UbiE
MFSMVMLVTIYHILTSLLRREDAMPAHSSNHPTGAGKTSFDFIDTALFFKALDLKPKQVFLDLACGRGVYTLAIAQRFSRAGRIIGIDLWAEGIDRLNTEAQARGLSAVEGLVGDAGKKIPVADASVDVLLIATALHDFYNDGIADNALRQIKRVVKPDGRILVIEFKKIAPPPGPPISSRLSPEEVVELLAAHDFTGTPATELGPFTYMMTFSSS